MEQFVALTRRALQLFTTETQARLLRVVTAEIHGFAHFVDAVLQALAGFQGAQRHQLAAVAFQQISQTLEHSGADVDRGGVPTRPGRMQGVQRLGSVGRCGELGAADLLAQVVRALHCLLGAGQFLPVDHRCGLPLTVEVRLIGELKLSPGLLDVHVEALGVFPRAAKQRRREGDFVITKRLELAQLRHRMIKK